MIKIMFKPLSLLLVLTLSVGMLGCQTVRDNPRTAGGAAIGAGSGALLGGVIGHQSGHAGAGALIGAGTGAAAGGLIGRQSDEQVRMEERVDQLERERYTYQQPEANGSYNGSYNGTDQYQGEVYQEPQSSSETYEYQREESYQQYEQSRY